MSDLWFSESTLNNSAQSRFLIEELLFEKQGKLQNIKVFKTKALGKLLTLNDAAMLSDRDEFIYHEVMVHPALLAQKHTKNVLVIGGGDGGIVRELTKYKSIENIELVEIDNEVIDVCREFFPQVCCSLNDPRVKIIIEDGVKYLQKKHREGILYDLIIVDSTDPIGLAEELYGSEFFELISSSLTEEGIFMSQTGNPFFDEFGISGNYQKLKSTFPIADVLTAPIFIYPGVFWTFGFASKRWDASTFQESKLSEYKEFSSNLRWHNLDWQKGCRNLGNFYRTEIFN